MKLILILLLCLCLLCASAAAFADSAPAFPELPDRLPDEYRETLAEGAGTVQRITYPSRDYAGDGAEVIKPALV